MCMLQSHSIKWRLMYYLISCGIAQCVRALPSYYIICTMSHVDVCNLIELISLEKFIVFTIYVFSVYSS